MSFVWGGIFSAQLVSVSTVGVIIAHLGARWPYIIAMPFAGLILVPVANNWLGEERVDKERCASAAMGKIRRQRNLFILSLAMGGVSVSMAIIGLTSHDQHFNFAASIAGAVIVIGGFWLLTPRLIAKLVTFFFAQNLFHVSIESASFYFFTDDEKMYPEGPHFSTEFYTTAIGIVSTVFSLIGITLYNCCMHKVGAQGQSQGQCHGKAQGQCHGKAQG